MSTAQTESEIIQRGVDIAQAATGSRIAYLHFINDDQSSIELGVWSHDTLAGCQAVYDRHYPIAAAGIWAESARTRRACIDNDYAAAQGKRGLPDGHVHLRRHLGLPVVDEGLVRMLVGVGNKPIDYDENDVALLDMVARRIWSLTRQRRLLEQYIDLARRFRHVQELALICGFEYDVDEDRISFDAVFDPIFHADAFSERPGNLAAFLERVAPGDHEEVRAAVGGEATARRVARITCLRYSGEHFPAELKVEFRPREVGRGVIGIGILQDISEELAVEDLRQRADHDPLTGLPNRRHLDHWFSQGLGRRGDNDGVAFLYVDLDDFKPVNDRFGHAAGDEVLRIVAQRLAHAVRKDDLVARLGGDEFAVVQTGRVTRESAAVLAGKIVKLIAEPITALGRPLQIGASVGVAISYDAQCALDEICAAADAALYKVKAAGGRRYLISGTDVAS
nr:sensor domain-containing diguanylate cyclase [Niveibacterium umoris]